MSTDYNDPTHLTRALNSLGEQLKGRHKDYQQLSVENAKLKEALKEAKVELSNAQSARADEAARVKELSTELDNARNLLQKEIDGLLQEKKLMLQEKKLIQDQMDKSAQDHKRLQDNFQSLLETHQRVIQASLPSDEEDGDIEADTNPRRQLPTPFSTSASKRTMSVSGSSKSKASPSKPSATSNMVPKVSPRSRNLATPVNAVNTWAAAQVISVSPTRTTYYSHPRRSQSVATVKDEPMSEDLEKPATSVSTKARAFEKARGTGRPRSQNPNPSPKRPHTPSTSQRKRQRVEDDEDYQEDDEVEDQLADEESEDDIDMLVPESPAKSTRRTAGPVQAPPRVRGRNTPSPRKMPEIQVPRTPQTRRR